MKNSAEWFLIEKIPKSFVFLLAGWARNLSRDFEEEFEGNVRVALLYQDGALNLFFKDREWRRAGKNIFQKSLATPEFLNKFNLKNKAIQKRQFEFCKILQKMKLKSLSDRDLAKLYLKLSEYHAESISIGWVDMVMEFRNELFSSYLTNYIKKKAKTAKLSQSGAEIFSLLSTPSRITIGKQEEGDFIKILEIILKNKKLHEFFSKNGVKKIDVSLKKISPRVSKILDAHVKKYGWIFHMYIGPAWDRIQFIGRIKEDIKQDNIVELIKESKNDQKMIVSQKRKLLKALKPDKKPLKLIELSSELVFNKDLRKHAIYFTCYSFKPLFDELAKRLKMNADDVKNVIPWELYKMFLKGDKKMIKEEARADRNLLMIFKDGVCQKKYGNKIDAFLKNDVIKEEEGETNFLKGSCAYPGKLRGIVRIVDEIEDMPKIGEGEILVAHQTNPDIIMAMKKAAGFITDLGGITCHAAIVSREMKKPCVVGTIKATKVLKDGMMVEVDADKGMVKIIK